MEARARAIPAYPLVQNAAQSEEPFTQSCAQARRPRGGLVAVRRLHNERSHDNLRERCSGCVREALAVQHGEEVVPLINRLAERFQNVVLTQAPTRSPFICGQLAFSFFSEALGDAGYF